MKHRNTSVVALASVCGLATSLFAAHRHMKVNSPIFNEMSGKLGGAVGFTTANGIILRGNVHPANPDTPAQFIVRGILTGLTSTWKNTLTALQRQSWDDLADLTPGSGSGINFFVKSNTERLRASLLEVDTAPGATSFEYTAPTAVTVDVSDARINYTLPAADTQPYQVLGGGVNIYVSREQPVTRTTRIHPFTYWGTKLGLAAFGALNQAKPADVGLVAGKVVYVKFVPFDDLGATGAPVVQRVTIQA